MSHLIHEPFTAEFTGQLVSFTSTQMRKTYRFNKPYPRVEKGWAFMMEIDLDTNKIRMIPVRT